MDCTVVWSWDRHFFISFLFSRFKGPVRGFLFAYVNRWDLLSGFSGPESGPQHSDSPLVMINAVKCCVLFSQESHLYCFSKALKFRMCTAIKYCSDFVDSVSIALQFCVAAHRILSSLPFYSVSKKRKQNKTVRYKLFYCLLGYFFVILVAVHWWRFFFLIVSTKVEIISFEEGNQYWGMCLISISLSMMRVITANPPM